MNLADVQENISEGAKTLYTGIENFQVIAVNPTLAELNAMGIPAKTEPIYTTSIKRDYGEGEKEYRIANIRLYLDNMDSKNPIKTSVTYTLVDTYQLSTTNKYKVINKYGDSSWLEEEAINDSSLIPKNMEWFLTEGVKKAKRGEDNLITFIKEYRNLPRISKQTDKENRYKGVAIFEDKDLEKLFNGDFSDIRNNILSINDAGKCGFLIGIKTLEDGRKVHDIYKEHPLKRYIKNNGNSTTIKYLVEGVINSQNSGMYSNTIFNLSNTTLQEFDSTTLDIEDTSEDSILEMTNVFSDEHDDLPF